MRSSEGDTAYVDSKAKGNPCYSVTGFEVILGWDWLQSLISMSVSRSLRQIVSRERRGWRRYLLELPLSINFCRNAFYGRLAWICGRCARNISFKTTQMDGPEVWRIFILVTNNKDVPFEDSAIYINVNRIINGMMFA